MSTRNYWVVSPNVKNNDEEESWKEFISKNPYSFIGWGPDNPQGKTFIDDNKNGVKKGDVIINAQRKNWKYTIFGIGIVESDDCNFGKIEGTPSEAYYRKLNYYIPKDKIEKLNLDFEGTTYNKGKKQIPAIYQLKPYNENDKKLVETIDKYLDKEKYMQDIVNLLKSNYNLILTGAPGTGKTYMAKEIAKQMIGVKTDDELKKSGQYAFIQFHPSYDYTDFVEGLRPTSSDENDNIGFELRDGIFKEFCQKAMESKNYSIIFNNFENAWDKLLEQVRENISQDKLTKIGSWEYGLSKRNSLKYTSMNTPSKYTFTITKKNVFDTYLGKKARPSGSFQKDMEDIVKYMKDNCGLVDFVNPQENFSNEVKNYVFVIDEINRGEISKIFGELFFSIDPGYRGEKGAVKTQYSNLHDDIDEMLYVPENVYIIGTMNDIDRSVESFDFAMRRRFVWKEITSKESQQMFDNESWKNEAIIRMNNLNAEIEKIEGLNSSYHIGAAYFKNNLSKYNDDEKWEKLWNLHLRPLLFEYLRGMPNWKDNLEKLEKAYNNNTNENDRQ